MPIAQVLAWYLPALVCYAFVFSICTPASLANASPHHPIFGSFYDWSFPSARVRMKSLICLCKSP